MIKSFYDFKILCKHKMIIWSLHFYSNFRKLLTHSYWRWISKGRLVLEVCVKIFALIIHIKCSIQYRKDESLAIFFSSSNFTQLECYWIYTISHMGKVGIWAKGVQYSLFHFWSHNASECLCNAQPKPDYKFSSY